MQAVCGQANFETEPPGNLKIKENSQIKEFWDSQLSAWTDECHHRKTLGGQGFDWGDLRLQI
jgi:hypothetical protein